MIPNFPYIEPNTLASITFDAKHGKNYVSFMGNHYVVSKEEFAKIGILVASKHKRLLSKALNGDHYKFGQAIQRQIIENVVSQWMSEKN